jgi:hypothetical protein
LTFIPNIPPDPIKLRVTKVRKAPGRAVVSPKLILINAPERTSSSSKVELAVMFQVLGSTKRLTFCLGNDRAAIPSAVEGPSKEAIPAAPFKVFSFIQPVRVELLVSATFALPDAGAGVASMLPVK